MRTRHQWTIDSTDDIHKTLRGWAEGGAPADRYSVRFDLRGSTGNPISVPNLLRGFYVVAHGPAPVYVGGDTTVQAVESAVVYTTEDGVVEAYDSATVYAYGRSEVTLDNEAAVFVASDDVLVTAYGSGTVHLPAGGFPGSAATVQLEGEAARIIRR